MVCPRTLTRHFGPQWITVSDHGTMASCPRIIAYLPVAVDCLSPGFCHLPCPISLHISAGYGILSSNEHPQSLQ